MKNPVEQINHIVSVDDFINFVTQLAMDAKEHPEEWVNPTIANYLEQIASWVDDCSCVEESFNRKECIIKHWQKCCIWERSTNKQLPNPWE